MTDGRKSSGFSVDSNVFLTMVSGGLRLRKPAGQQTRRGGGQEGEKKEMKKRFPSRLQTEGPHTPGQNRLTPIRPFTPTVNGRQVRKRPVFTLSFGQSKHCWHFDNVTFLSIDLFVFSAVVPLMEKLSKWSIQSKTKNCLAFPLPNRKSLKLYSQSEF